MSAVVRWRCDICKRDAEVVQEYERRGVISLFVPRLPRGWRTRAGYRDEASLDICSQACLVTYADGLAAHERRKLDAAD